MVKLLPMVYLNLLSEPGEGGQQRGPRVRAAHSKHGRLGNGERVAVRLHEAGNLLLDLRTALVPRTEEGVHELEQGRKIYIKLLG